MALWERRYLLKQFALNSDNQTFSNILPRAGVASAFLVKLAYTNGATGGGGQDIADIVTKIEVIANGSDVLFSLSGVELLKWSYIWEMGRCSQLRDARAGNTQYCMFPVLFGRFLGDKDYTIDCAAYNQLELRITYAPTISATQFATLTGVLDIIGIFWPQNIAPPPRKGFLRTVQVRKITTAASGEDPTILSTRFRMAGILVYCFQTGIAEGVPVTTTELRLNGGVYIPMTGRWVDWQEENEREESMYEDEEQYTLLPDASTIETRCGRILSVNSELIFADAADTLVPILRTRSIAGGQITIAQVSAAGSGVAGGGAVDTTARPAMWRARGIGMGNAIFLPFMRNGDDQNVLETPSYTDARLINIQGASGADLRVSTWEIVPGSLAAGL